MSNIIEIVFYIHGVSQHIRGYSHEKEYSAFNKGICKYQSAWPTNFKGVEWGWNYEKTPNPKSHELLTDAQRLLGSRALAALRDPWDITANPVRPVINGLRKLFIYGFGDMFYYVSSHGKQAVRRAVAEQFSSYIKPTLKNDDDLISLTLVGHSAGSVIAFDLLFYLFQNLRNEYKFVISADALDSEVINDLNLFRQKAQEGNFRLRRLITLGSPITPLVCRNDDVLKILANNENIDPKNYGLTTQSESFDKLEGPRWINIWDKDDPIAWPVEPLMRVSDDKGERIVEDVYTDVSDLVSKAHNSYWFSSKAHKEVANRW
jgi:hypothetical protein